jgi:hypothetical protein
VLKTVRITCPSCGSADLEGRSASDYRCNHCGTFFVAKPAAPDPAAPEPIMPRWTKEARPRRPAPFIVAGVLVALVVVGATTSMVILRSGSVAPPPPAYEPPPSTYEPASASAELGAQIDGTTRNGLRFWLIDYRNTGIAEITNAGVVVSLFDASGARVAEQTGYSTVKRLQPGKRTTILVLLNTAVTQQRAEISMMKPSSSSYGLPEVELTVSDFRENPTFGSLRDIIGTVRNPNKRQVRFVNVLIVGRDSNEQPVSYATGTASQSEIDAGGQSGFSVGVGTFEVEPPKKWEVTVVGSPL